MKNIVIKNEERTIVTTPLLGLELRNKAGLRDEGRSFWPEKSAERLLPAKEESKLDEREARGEEEEDVV